MATDTEVGDAARYYATAYAAHHNAQDYPLALRLYRELTESHPNTREADCSRAQIKNIINVEIGRNPQRTIDTELTTHLTQELRKLESECLELTAERDRVFSIVETGEDTGFRLIMVLNDLRQVNERLEQISQLLSLTQERPEC